VDRSIVCLCVQRSSGFIRFMRAWRGLAVGCVSVWNPASSAQDAATWRHMLADLRSNEIAGSSSGQVRVKFIRLPERLKSH
jgi:hypothetical protein